MRSKNFLLLIFSLVLLGILSEGVLRLVFKEGITANYLDPSWEWIQYDPFVSWKNKALYERGELNINAHHFRSVTSNQEIEPKKDSKKIRIVCMGDSRTFGILADEGRIRFDNAYPQYLAQYFSQHAPQTPIEIINAGVIGYSSSQGLRQLTTQILDLQADILIVNYGFNDPSLAWAPSLRAQEFSQAWQEELLGRVQGWRSLGLLWLAYQRGDFFHPAPFSVPWTDLQRFEKNLALFQEIANKHEIKLAFLTLGLRPLSQGDSKPSFPTDKPMDYALYGAKDLSELHQHYQQYLGAMFAIGEQKQVEVIDAATHMMQNPQIPWFNAYDSVHVTPEGAQALAEMIGEAIVRKNWLMPKKAL